MTKIKTLLLAGALALGLISAAGAAGLFTNGLPTVGGSQYPTTLPMTGVETIPMDTNLTSGLNPASEAVTTKQLAGYVAGSVGTWRNLLIGGDFGTNLWQRGTTSASITTALLYTADRWWGLSGTGTAFTVSKQTGASDITTAYQASARVQRTAAQTGVLPVCFGQVLTTANSINLQGKVAEFSFRALAGATFSAAGSNITATIAYGTGSNESAANFSTGSWTGYTAGAAQVTTISTTWTKYSAVATIPVTATQVGVKICYTPVGTAGATDFVELAAMQLAANPAAVAATSSTTAAQQTLAYEHRPAEVEQMLQQAYYYEIDESATITPIAPCAAIDTTHTNCLVQFPVKMRIAPTVTYTTGFASPTSTTQATLGACTALANAATVASTASNPLNVLVNCTATTIPAAGVASWLYSNGGSGKILATSEL